MFLLQIKKRKIFIPLKLLPTVALSNVSIPESVISNIPNFILVYRRQT